MTDLERAIEAIEIEIAEARRVMDHLHRHGEWGEANNLHLQIDGLRRALKAVELVADPPNDGRTDI